MFSLFMKASYRKNEDLDKLAYIAEYQILSTFSKQAFVES